MSIRKKAGYIFVTGLSKKSQENLCNVVEYDNLVLASKIV